MDITVKNYIERIVVSALSKELDKKVPATFTISAPADDVFFVSDLIFADIKFEDDNKPLSVVIKKWPNVHEHVNMFQAMFNNEILFYTRYANNCSIRFPRCYFASNAATDSVLVLENVAKSGYYMSPKSVALDLDYVFASVKEIARFHGAGYVMKTNQPKEFKEIVKECMETKYHLDNVRLKIYVNTLAPRCIDHLRSINYDSKFCDQMEDFLKDAFQKGLIDCLPPVEPLATLCHGDFLRNNVLFKSKDNKMKAMLIDFATIRYATPAIDLSTFFHMCCSRYDMVHRFDEIFAFYCNTLHDYLDDNGTVAPGDFTSNALRADYKRNAIHGFVIASFFLPIMMYGCDIAPKEGFFNAPIEEYSKASLSIGGDEMTKLLAEMLLDLRHSGCLDHLLGHMFKKLQHL